jgi:hypothetical protein
MAAAIKHHPTDAYASVSITLCLYNLSSCLLTNFQIHGMNIQLNQIKLLNCQEELMLVSTAASYFNGNIYQAFSLRTSHIHHIHGMNFQ